MGRLILISFFLAVSVQLAAPAEQAIAKSKDGTLIVLMTWNDADSTPTTGAYVEARSTWVADQSFFLKMVKAGQYEATLPAGVYDVFVSEASSQPRCRRVLVTAGYTPTWKLMLEHDDVYLENSASQQPR